MDLDAVLGGFKRGDLIVLAARTGVGKTALMLNFARNAAVGEHATVAFFSLEMSGDQLAMRLLSAEADVTQARLRLGRHREDEERKVMDAIGLLSDSGPYIDDSTVSTVLSVREIGAKCVRLQADRGLDLVVVDSLRLMRKAPTSGAGSIPDVVIRELKALARTLSTPVVVSAQLLASVDTRIPPIPMLSDLDGMGAIEEHADVVLFLYREDASPLAQIIIAKHRNGPTDTITVRFVNHTATFQDLVLREQAEPAFTE